MSRKTRSWSEKAIEESCKGQLWEDLLSNMEESVKKRLTQLGLTHLSELSEKEQELLIGNEIINMNHSTSQGSQIHNSLIQFSRSMKSCVDAELVSHLNHPSLSSPLSYHLAKPNQQLLSTCSEEIIRLLENSNASMRHTMKLFVNRKLPQSLRRYIWLKSLQSSTSTHKHENFSPPLPPSSDVILTRQAYSILDRHFPEYSSRSNANFIKTVIGSFHRQQSPELRDKTVESVFDQIDQMAEKLLVKEFTSDRSLGYEEGLSKLLFALIDQCRSAVSKLPTNGSIDVMTIIQIKDDELYNLLNVSQDADNNKLPFRKYIDRHLECGLADWLSLTCVEYIWDQGFILNFQDILNIYSASVILGSKEEIQGLRHLSHILETIDNFAKALTLPVLRQLVFKYCSKELLNIFDMNDSYLLEISLDTKLVSPEYLGNYSDDNVLQAVYKQLTKAQQP